MGQGGPILQHRELCSMLCGSLDGRGVWGRMNTWMCMTESLCYPPETVTTLLIGYSPVQNWVVTRSDGKESSCNAGDLGLIPGSGRSSGEGNGYSCIFAWRIPWTEDPGRLQSMGLQRVGYDWATNTYIVTKQCCDCFTWTAKGLSHTYTGIHSPPNSPPIQAAT